MSNRILSWRQWNLSRSSFVGVARKKECSPSGSALSSSSSVSTTTTSHRIHVNINDPPAIVARRRRREDAPYRLAMGLLTRSLSTTPWYAPQNTDSLSSSQQPQPPPPSPSVPTRLPLGEDGSQRKDHDFAVLYPDFVVLYPDFVARSAYLEDVAFWKLVDNTVCMDDYLAALKGWKKLAIEGARTGKDGKKASSSGGIAAARGARSLLQALERNMEHPEASTASALLHPDAHMYNVVLQAYAVCGGGVVAAMEAQALLDGMLEKARGTLQARPPQWTPNPPEPTIESFNIVLTCWGKASRNPCHRASVEAVLSRMEEWRRHCHASLQRDPSIPYRGCYPTTTTLCELIYALNDPDRAWQLLQEVVEVQRNPHTSISEHRFHNVRLEPVLFKSVIFVWTFSGRGTEGAAKAGEILSLAAELHDEGLMEKVPCKRSYALVLDAWSRCEKSTGAQRAHDVLFNMIRLYRQGAPIEFNVVAFQTCIEAWSRCANVKGAPEKAEAILQELLSLHDQTSLVDFQPNLALWHVMQTVWLNATKRSESMDRCAEVVQRMQRHGCQPTSQSYGIILQAATRRRLGDQALALLERCNALDLDFPLHRNVYYLNAVLEALAMEPRHDSMDRATAFFEKMKCEDIYAKPDAYSYTILLEALLRSKGRQHAERGRDLLEEMMQHFQQGNESCRPNVHVVLVVLRLCASSNDTDDDRRRALDIALETFRKCESYFGVSPNHLVYSAMLNAINRLAASENQRSERLELLEKVFEECCALGHVSALTLRIMRQGGASHCLSGLTSYSCREVPKRCRPDTVSDKECRSDS